VTLKIILRIIELSVMSQVLVTSEIISDITHY